MNEDGRQDISGDGEKIARAIEGRAVDYVYDIINFKLQLRKVLLEA